MPTWDQFSKFVTDVGLPTTLVLVGIGSFLWYFVRPLSENFLGKEGWIAKWFHESVESQKCMREAVDKLTETGERQVSLAESHKQDLAAMRGELSTFCRFQKPEQRPLGG